MASRASLILRNASFSLAAISFTAGLQYFALRIRVVVCPSPDVAFHPEILSKPKIVLGFFRSVH
jgi:hypothetical protein